MNFDIHRLTETASTNDDARDAAEQGAPEGTVIWALSQSSGRGRHGRQWSSPPGNLYCSVVLRPTGDLTTYGQYSFIAALALADVVSDCLVEQVGTECSSLHSVPVDSSYQQGWGARKSTPSLSPGICAETFAALIQLKWPNDVLVNGKKISGILLESGEGYLIVGMGLNVLHTPNNPLYPTTSLSAENITPPSLESILGDLLRNLDHWCATLRIQGFAPIRAAWLSRARKGPMRVRLPDGEVQGTFVDLDQNGNLVLLLPDNTKRCIHTGDVFF
jgi:BirA family biotin operon repressor/biotin-[acetyl-CoA-carboxylase] ligase